MINLETELKSETNLCSRKGKLNPDAIGWSRHPLHRCNLRRNWLRKKKWNYWCIYDDDFLVSMTISDVDYAGLVFVYYLDLKTLELKEKTLTIPFGRGIGLGELVGNDAFYEKDGIRMTMTHEDETLPEIHLHYSDRDFYGAAAEIDLIIPILPDHETMNVVIPWSRKRYQFTSKQFGLQASGSVKFGTRQHQFKDARAVLDFGRGVWPYSSKWNWASLTSVDKNNTVALNMGAGWTDGTGYTENAIFLNGRIYKLSENILFEYNKDNYMAPWKIQTEKTGSIDLVFSPVYERVAASNLLVVASEVHQMFGYFSGQVKVGSNIYPIEEVLGWAEDHVARW